MRFIIYAGYIDLAKLISSKLGLEYLSASLSERDREAIFRRMRDGETTGIVTAQLAEEGVNIPELDVVIQYNSGKSFTQLIQKSGRTMRTHKRKKLGYYIVFVLENMPYEKDWSRYALKEFSNVFKVIDRKGVDEIEFNPPRTFKATQIRRRDLKEKGEDTEKKLLKFLENEEPMTAYEISKKLGWSKGKVNKALRRLTEKSLISYYSREDGGRVKTYFKA